MTWELMLFYNHLVLCYTYAPWYSGFLVVPCILYISIFHRLGLDSLWSSDTIWWHRSLAQVMACCLAAPAITWTYVDFSLVRVSGLHVREISPWVPKLLFCIMRLKMIVLQDCHISQLNNSFYWIFQCGTFCKHYGPNIFSVFTWDISLKNA